MNGINILEMIPTNYKNNRHSRKSSIDLFSEFYVLNMDIIQEYHHMEFRSFTAFFRHLK